MKMHVLIVILGLACSTVSGFGGTEAQILECGIFSGGSKLTLRDTRSPNGKLLLGEPVKLEKQTSTIPARLNLEFGIRFIVTGVADDSPVKLHLVYSFPEVNNVASGKRSNRYEVDVTVKPKDKNSFMLWDLTEPAELVLGQWTFQVFQDNRMLLEQRFQMVREKRACMFFCHS